MSDRLKSILKRDWADDGRRYVLTRWVYLRMLGIVYLIAFVSLWVQLPGLIGQNGILPAADFVEMAREQLGPGGIWRVPTLCWFGASDAAILAHGWLGAGFALLLAVGVAPRASAIACWSLYLSLTTAGQDFLGFQWDNLLLEAGFLSIFLAPGRWLPGVHREHPPSWTIILLHRWLLFRLMLMSGAVKLLSADAAWWQLTALNVHYETQPLPTWIGWYAHQLPEGMQHGSVMILFLIELAVPLLIFGPRRFRRFACGAIIVLMVLIALTGNYGFFNLLTIALCVLLLDDQAFRRWFPPGVVAILAEAKPAPIRRGRVAAMTVFAVFVVTLSFMQLGIRWFPNRIPSPPVLGALDLVAPFRSLNNYGLFAVMTVDRPEIIIEGSDDGRNWKAYEFRWKPGDPSVRPRFVAPHMPRLDWQMWFAALGDYRDSPWFTRLLAKLLEGSPETIRLLESNPFPDEPPRFIRSVRYRYRFSDRSTRHEDGDWWVRESAGLFSPPMSLKR